MKIVTKQTLRISFKNSKNKWENKKWSLKYSWKFNEISYIYIYIYIYISFVFKPQKWGYINLSCNSQKSVRQSALQPYHNAAISFGFVFSIFNMYYEFMIVKPNSSYQPCTWLYSSLTKDMSFILLLISYMYKKN